MSAPRLGIDTATAFLALALWWPDDDRTERRTVRVDRDLGRRLVAEVDAFLHAHGVAVGDLAGLGVGVGPGSYTGARVGVAFALGLARARGLPVVGGDTAAARAAACVSDEGPGWIALEGRRGTAVASRWVRLGSRVELVEVRPAAPLGELPHGAAASLAVAPDAVQHARTVDAPDAAPPRVRYG